jgi:hypothetical protein
MIQARKKAGLIIVDQLTEDNLPINTSEVAGHYFVQNRLHNSQIGIKLGDYVRVDNPDDTYPIDAAYFAENYEVVDEDYIP